MKRTTVLAIEDSADHALLLRLALELELPEVDFRIAPSAAHARSYLSGEGSHSDRSAFPFPDLILIDMWLGDATGLDVLEWIARIPHLAMIPSVMLTSDPDPFIEENAMAMGANAFMEKPADFRSIGPELKRVLEEHRGPGSAGEESRRA